MIVGLVKLFDVLAVEMYDFQWYLFEDILVVFGRISAILTTLEDVGCHDWLLKPQK